MKKIMLMISSFLAITASASIEVRQPLAGKYEEARGELLTAEQVSREMMAKLYSINRRMKSISNRRDQLNNKLILAEGNVRSLTQSTMRLQDTLSEQKVRLSKRLRALYMLGEDRVARAIFSASNSEDLQQTLRYLKIFTEQDYKLIKTYQSNLQILSRKKEKLEKELRQLVQVRKSLLSQEELLTKEQGAKSEFLSHLEGKKGKALQKLKNIRKKMGAQNEIALDLSFFEKKGQLIVPFRGALTQAYGMIENEKYGYKLSHKGHLYRSIELQPVRSIHSGIVSFAGALDGHGMAVVIDHGDHYYSVYSGLSSLEVKEGESVEAGRTLSKAEQELYFEIRHFSDAIDPKQWLVSQRGEL